MKLPKEYILKLSSKQQMQCSIKLPKLMTPARAKLSGFGNNSMDSQSTNKAWGTEIPDAKLSGVKGIQTQNLNR